MKKQANRIFSILLTLVMLLSLLPMPAQAATAYTKAGEIGAVTAECAPIAAPTLGGEVINSFHVTVTSPTDKGLVNPTGDAVQWQRKSGDTWMDYTEESFDEGTYRLCIRLTSIARSDDSYYALVQTTTLTVNDTPFTPGDAPSDNDYKIRGNASMDFYSQEYTVTKEAGTYLVTVTAGVNGRASADKAYGKTGEVVTLTAEPYTGYRLKEWRVVSGGVTVENDQFTIGSEDVAIKAIFESTNEHLGDIQQIEVTTKEGVDYRPIMGSTAGRIDVTVQSSTPNDDTLYVAGYGCGIWEVKQPDGSWEHFINKTFAYGTYRMSISLRNEVVDGKYHALTKDTVLIVDGEEWTVEPDSLYTYYSLADGYGTISFGGPEMEGIPLLNVSYSTQKGCHVEPVLGEFTVPQGDPFSFTVEPDDHYELTDPEALEVYVNDVLVTPDEDGVYTVSTVDELELDIYVDGDAFTGYSNLIVSANGRTVTEKVYVGDTYTFKTLAAFGAAAPAGSVFAGWKIGGKTYQPGDTYTVTAATDIKVNAAFTGLYNVTVENGKAYADEAHTQPISVAAENQVIYIVADPAPAGKVFSYWSRTFATVGGHGWFGDSESAETTFTVYDSDVVLTPVYETLVDEIVINGMTKPSAGVAVDNSDYSYKWGCSVPANSGYSLGICYWYDITTGEDVSMSSGDVFQIGHTYHFKARISLYGDTVFPANAEDISVTLTGIDAEDYQCTINEIGYTSATIYFEFTCPREEPDTSFVRPKGDGSEGNPFQITNVGELYWFAGFVNETITADDITVNIDEACAKVMNDITVNHDLLADDYTLNVSGEDTDLLAVWTPIAPPNGYKGTFDGQGHTISGIYCAPQAAADYRYGGFFRSLFKGGCIRDLTLADSYFRAPAKNSAYTGAFVGYIASSCTVENCHFDGTVTTAITADSSNEDKETYQYVHIAGIAGSVAYGEIRDCTARGLISGYGSEMGGIAAYVRNSEVTGCVNEATVENSYSGDTGGIVGIMVSNGIIRDCRNKGNVIGRSSAGIVGNVESKGGEVIRCWNEGDIQGYYTAGIVAGLSGTVLNCYNAGSAIYAGIVGTPYPGCSITYCHNVGSITDGSDQSIIGYTRNSCTITDCYYLETGETDALDGTTYKTASDFADGTVLALLNNGHWTQGPAYPVLADPPISVSGTVTVSGASAAVEVTVEELSDVEGTLIVARYADGCLMEIRLLTVTGDGVWQLTGADAFAFGEGSQFVAFLVDGDCVPLCASVPLTVEDQS